MACKEVLGVTNLSEVNGSLLSKEEVEDYLSCLSREAFQARMPVVLYLGSIAVLGFLGNSLVLGVFWNDKHLSANRTFIMCMAFQDLFTSILGPPSTIISLRYAYNAFSVSFCQTQFALTTMSAQASSYILVAVALDRYQRIWFPHTVHLTPRQAVKVSVAITAWTCAMFGAFVPLYGIWLKDSGVPGVDVRMCWNDNDFRAQVYTTVLEFLFCASFVSMLGSYMLIAVKFWKKTFDPMALLHTTLNQNEAVGRNSVPRDSLRVGTTLGETGPSVSESSFFGVPRIPPPTPVCDHLLSRQSESWDNPPTCLAGHGTEDNGKPPLLVLENHDLAGGTHSVPTDHCDSRDCGSVSPPVTTSMALVDDQGVDTLSVLSADKLGITQPSQESVKGFPGMPADTDSPGMSENKKKGRRGMSHTSSPPRCQGSQSPSFIDAQVDSPLYNNSSAETGRVPASQSRTFKVRIPSITVTSEPPHLTTQTLRKQDGGSAAREHQGVHTEAQRAKNIVTISSMWRTKATESSSHSVFNWRTQALGTRGKRVTRSTTRMMAVLTICYVINWLPHIVIRRYHTGPVDYCDQLVNCGHNLWSLGYNSYYLNTVANVCVYSLLCGVFRKSLVRFLHKVRSGMFRTGV